MWPQAKDAWGHREPEEGLEQLLPESPEGTNPADTLVLDFRPPELEGMNFCGLKPPRVW